MRRRKDYPRLDFAEGDHASDDTLERYAMGRLPEPEMIEFEEHLLVCDRCQDRLALEDSIRQRVRDGAVALEPARDVVWWRSPKLGWASALAAAGLLFVAGYQWRSVPRPTAAPAVVLLQATRGAEEMTPAAPAGRPLTVVLDVTGLPQFREYKLEVVLAAGRPVFQTSAAPQGTRLQATLSGGLAADAYFVRVSTPTGELLREFALLVRG